MQMETQVEQGKNTLPLDGKARQHTTPRDTRQNEAIVKDCDSSFKTLQNHKGKGNSRGTRGVKNALPMNSCAQHAAEHTAARGVEQRGTHKAAREERTLHTGYRTRTKGGRSEKGEENMKLHTGYRTRTEKYIRERQR